MVVLLMILSVNTGPAPFVQSKVGVGAALALRGSAKMTTVSARNPASAVCLHAQDVKNEKIPATR